MDIVLVDSLIDVLSVHFIVYKSSIIIFIACNLTTPIIPLFWPKSCEGIRL
jgi:hypothetical protein